MRPGQVSSDAQAFQQIRGRLVRDVGKIINFVARENERRNPKDEAYAPFWALLRATFPIAESIGDLIHFNDSTGRNLILALQNQFEAVRPGYRGKANILAVLYRHSLMHQDEMRCLLTDKKEIIWIVTFGEKACHLDVRKEGDNLTIHFDTTAFYDDLVKVLDAAEKAVWNGEVMQRYNGWLTLDIDTDKDAKYALVEAKELFKGLK